MRVRCRTNQLADQTIAQLTEGETYIVYALGLDTRPSVYITDDAFVDGPRRYPLELFEIVDGAVSAHWHLAVDHARSEDATILAPQAWLREEAFFERALDGEDDAVAVFAALKRTLDVEAAGCGTAAASLTDRDRRQLRRMAERLALFERHEIDLEVLVADLAFLLDAIEDLDAGERGWLRAQWEELEIEYALGLHRGKRDADADARVAETVGGLRRRVALVLGDDDRHR